MVHFTKNLGSHFAGPPGDEFAGLASSAGSIRLRKLLTTSNSRKSTNSAARACIPDDRFSKSIFRQNYHCLCSHGGYKPPSSGYKPPSSRVGERLRLTDNRTPDPPQRPPPADRPCTTSALPHLPPVPTPPGRSAVLVSWLAVCDDRCCAGACLKWMDFLLL